MNEYRAEPMPDEFHSAETDKPFTTCYDCGTELLAVEDGYLVQKAYNKDECIMEIAQCVPCQQKLQKSYSKQSLNDIWDYFLDNIDFKARYEKYHPLPTADTSPWTNNCAACGTSRARAQEYTIVGQCYSIFLICGEYPMMLCLQCIDNIINLLSEESRKTYDEWIDRCLPSPPGETQPAPERRRAFI